VTEFNEFRRSSIDLNEVSLVNASSLSASEVIAAASPPHRARLVMSDDGHGVTASCYEITVATSELVGAGASGGQTIMTGSIIFGSDALQRVRYLRQISP